MSKTEQEGLLSRWSRRKLEAEEAARSEVIAPAVGPADAADLPMVKAEGAELQTPELESPEPALEPILTDADMPPIESLNENSDFSAFMSSGVSDELRNLALRKMFQAPSFNIRDGLDEYDEDYTFFEKLGDIVTCDMKHQVEMKELRKKEAEEEQAEQDRLAAETEALAETETDVAEEDEPDVAELEEIPEPEDEAEMDKNDAI